MEKVKSKKAILFAAFVVTVFGVIFFFNRPTDVTNSWQKQGVLLTQSNSTFPTNYQILILEDSLQIYDNFLILPGSDGYDVYALPLESGTYNDFSVTKKGEKYTLRVGSDTEYVLEKIGKRIYRGSDGIEFKTDKVIDDLF